MSIFDRAKNKLNAGVLSSRWSNVKKGKSLNLPRADFGIKLDKFESSSNEAQSIATEIKSLLEKLKQEKEKCKERYAEADKTAKLYLSQVDAGETGVTGVLDKIIKDIEAVNTTVDGLPTNLS